MPPPEEKRKLEEVGTRHSHYHELMETFEEGIIAISQIRPQYVSKNDEMLKVHLTSARDLIQKQIDMLSDFEAGKWRLRDIINDIPKIKEG